MRPLHRIALLPVAAGLLVVLAAAFTAPGPERAQAFFVVIEAVKLASLVGCAVAAATFDRGDYMRWAWGLNAACFGLLLARDATLTAGSASLPLVRGVLVSAANASSVAGTFLLARALSVAGLTLGGSALARGAAVVGAVLLSIAITGGAFVLDVRALLGGDLVAIVAIASDLGDTLSLALLAPVLLSAVAMRGGSLVWPWSLLGAGLFAWLVYDAAAPLAVVGGVDPTRLELFREVLRALACAFVLSGALAHRAIVKGLTDDLGSGHVRWGRHREGAVADHVLAVLDELVRPAEVRLGGALEHEAERVEA